MIVGIALFGVGLLLHVFPSFPVLGKLPGDIRIERPGFRLYLPITSCLLLSALLSAGSWLLSRWR
jgi:hypothetical protein